MLLSVTATATFRTRSDSPAPATGGTLYVNAATGSDANDGLQANPFKTIQRAVDAAAAGMTVRVGPGIYRESVTVEGSHGGAEGSPLWLVADPGAVVDGSDPGLEDGTAFQDDGGGIWSAPFEGECLYAAVDDERLYDYPSLAELQSGIAGVSGGFFVDNAAGRIRVKMPAGDSPASHQMHIARLPVAFLLDTVTDVVIEGFEMRYFGSAEYSGVGVDLRDTSRAWVRKNQIHHMNEGVRIRRSNSADNVVELNTIRDTSVWSWPWEAVKAHTPEATAISVTGAGGNVVRRNTTRGTFNGVYVGSFDDMSEGVAPDTDIYENELYEHGDDGFEPEGACVNVRFWNNAIHGAHNGISLAPIAVGPVWAIRNLLEGYKAHALKINNGPTGWMLVYHNTSVPALGDSQAFAPTEPFASLVTRNNLWTGHRYVIESSITPSGAVDLDYDNLHTDSPDGTPRFVKWLDVRYANIDELKASNTIEQHGWSIVPSYENAAAGDYSLAQGNPLVDVGTIIPGVNDQGFAGAGPDVGAFERGGIAPGNDAGVPDGWAGTGGTAGGPSGQGGAGGSLDGGAPAVIDPASGDDGGCGCRTSAVRGSLWQLIAVASLALLRRLRSRR